MHSGIEISSKVFNNITLPAIPLSDVEHLLEQE